jgi:signal transduction histidine kinase
MDGTLTILFVIINVVCFSACVSIFWFLKKRQKAYLRKILREQFKGGLVMDANVTQNIHDVIINEQLFDTLKHIRQFATQNPSHKAALDHIIHKIDAVEQSLRGISNDIFPAHISVAFVRICKNKIQDLADLYDFEPTQIKFEVEGDFEKIPYQMLLIGLYRLINSFVGNALKHYQEAQISAVSVVLSLKNGTIVLSMSDNGRGFDIAKAMDWSIEMQHRGLSDFQNLAIALSLGADESDYEFYSVPLETELAEHGTFFELKISLKNYLEYEIVLPT